jgi:hypothetical protein
MPFQVSQSEVGTVHKLDKADSAMLEDLGSKLLEGTDGHRCIGIEPSGTVYPRLLTAIHHLDLIKQVVEITVSEQGATFIGVEVIGNQTMGITYRRPVADDAPREASKQKLLKSAMQMQLPLFDNILVGADESNRDAVEPGQIFIPRPNCQYSVMIPSDAVNMEIVLAGGSEVARQTWEDYMDAQPHPVH